MTRAEGGHARGVAALGVVTLIWGSTFVVIKGAVDDVPPDALVVGRFFLAGVCALPLARRDAAAWRAGFDLGFWLWIGYTTQAIGLQHTTAGRSAFITATSVVLVPVLVGWGGLRVPGATWAASALALAGVALLAWDGSPPNRGDAWTVATAVAYAVYVLRLEAYTRRVDVRALVASQLWAVVPLGLFGMLLAGAPGDPAVVIPAAAKVVSSNVALAVVYLGLVATGLTTLLQTYGQRRVSAAEAALIFTAEPVWAALFAFATFGERLGERGWVGAALVLAAMLLSQLGVARRR